MIKCEGCNKEFKNKGGYSSHKKTCDYVLTIKNEIISLYVDSLVGINEIGKKYGIGKDIVIRDPVESITAAIIPYTADLPRIDPACARKPEGRGLSRVLRFSGRG